MTIWTFAQCHSSRTRNKSEKKDRGFIFSHKRLICYQSAGRPFGDFIIWEHFLSHFWISVGRSDKNASEQSINMLNSRERENFYQSANVCYLGLRLRLRSIQLISEMEKAGDYFESGVMLGRKPNYHHLFARWRVNRTYSCSHIKFNF